MFEHELQTAERSIEKALTYGKEIVLKYSIKYPQFATVKFNFFIERLNKHYANKANSLLHYCDFFLYKNAMRLYRAALENGEPFHPFEFAVEYKVAYNQNCALSIYFDKYRYEGGANGNSHREADNWDWQKGNEITLHELFPGRKDYRIYLEKEIDKKITEQLSNNVNYYFDGFEKLVQRNFDARNYFITESGVNIFFQEISIAPHSSGILVFEFPFAEGYAVAPECKTAKEALIQNSADEEVDPYKIRSALLMNASNSIGALTPEQSASIWAEGLKIRSGAMQYVVMTRKMKKNYADLLEESNPGWVTGVSSPWIGKYTITEKHERSKNSFRFKINFDTYTSTGYWNSYVAEINVVEEDNFWRVSSVDTDTELEAYTMSIN